MTGSTFCTSFSSLMLKMAFCYTLNKCEHTKSLYWLLIMAFKKNSNTHFTCLVLSNKQQVLVHVLTSKNVNKIYKKVKIALISHYILAVMAQLFSCPSRLFKKLLQHSFDSILNNSNKK